VTLDTNKWPVTVNTIMNLRISQNAWNLSTLRGTVSFMRWTLLHGVSFKIKINSAFMLSARYLAVPVVACGSHFWIYCFIVMSVYEKISAPEERGDISEIQDTECTYNLPETYLCKHWCRGKAISITYSERVSAALVTSMHSTCVVLYCHLWLLWPYHIFPH